ncbi:ATP-binding protein [Paraburkholderia azotifigens]|uniref:ATP-binding protein n=1 Tax=Paraburkholderia azotifigens TaxID=2057004 RepID=UPI00316D5360
MIEKIKKILAVEQPIKAREVARMLGADASHVNSVLHAHRGDEFIQDDEFRWSLRLPAELIIQFPAIDWLTADHFERALDAVDCPLESDYPAVVFKFAPDTSVLLEAAARLLSLCNQLVAAQKSVMIEFQDRKVSSYLNRLGFYDVLDKAVKVLPRRPKRSMAEAREGESDAVVEAKAIDLAHRDETVPHRLEARVRQHVAGATTPMHTIVSELFSNIYEHSSSPIPGFAALQLYRGPRPHVAVVFSDSGTGIAGSLLPTLSARRIKSLKQSEKDIGVALIEKIFAEGGLSRMQEDGHGTGLYCTGDAVGKFQNGTIIVRQETFQVTLNFLNGKQRFSHRLGLRKLSGTHICVKFRLTRRK